MKVLFVSVFFVSAMGSHLHAESHYHAVADALSAENHPVLEASSAPLIDFSLDWTGLRIAREASPEERKEAAKKLLFAGEESRGQSLRVYRLLKKSVADQLEVLFPVEIRAQRALRCPVKLPADVKTELSPEAAFFNLYPELNREGKEGKVKAADLLTVLKKVAGSNRLEVSAVYAPDSPLVTLIKLQVIDKTDGKLRTLSSESPAQTSIGDLLNFPNLGEGRLGLAIHQALVDALIEQKRDAYEAELDAQRQIFVNACNLAVRKSLPEIQLQLDKALDE